MTRVRAEDLETGAVSRRTIRKGAVGWDELDPWMRPGGARFAVGVTSAVRHLAPGHLPRGLVQAPALDDASVTPPAIAPDAVTGPAIADGSVTGPKVPAGALGARELADGSLTLPKFAQGTRPVQIVDGLPSAPLDAGFLPGDAVVNVEDDDVKIHRLSVSPSGWDRWSVADDMWDAAEPWPSGVWTSAVDTTDLKGVLAEGNFGDDLIVARMIAADQVGATELAAIRLEVDKWIRSFDWQPGEAGWAIDGDGYFELAGGVIRGNTQIGGVVTEQIVSPDYDSGVPIEQRTGWAIDGTGNAEFHDVTIRGGSVVGAGLVSSDYQAGSQGWALDADGNAELNDATFRGSIKASSVTSGQLVSAFYSPGVEGWALDADGTVEIRGGIIRGSLYFASGTEVEGEVDSAQSTASSAQSTANSAAAEAENAKRPEHWRSGAIGPGEAGTVQIAGNYTQGVEGWAIDSAGNAEFNDVTVRGVLDTRADGQGVFVDETFLYFYTGHVGETNRGSLLSYIGSESPIPGAWWQTPTINGDWAAIDLNSSYVSFLRNNSTAFQVALQTGNLFVNGEMFSGGGSSYGVGQHPSRDWLSVTSNGARKAGFGAGALAPETNAGYDIGASVLRFDMVYCNTLNEVSDVRGKTIDGRSPGLDLIGKLEPVSYHRKGVNRYQPAGKSRLGLTAQQVASVLHPDTHDVVTVDDDGVPSGIAYTQLVAPLVASVQELAARVEALETA